LNCQAFALCIFSCLLEQVRRNVHAGDNSTQSSRGKRKISGTTRNVQNAHPALKIESSDELFSVCGVSFRNLTKIAGDPRRPQSCFQSL
jgi:hypothetical protein